MKLYKFLTGLCVAAAAVLTIVALAANTANYMEPGGSKWVIGSGGELDVETGGSLKLNGTAITSTAAELNAVDAGNYSTNGILLKRVARATLDCGTASCTSGATVDLSVDLPANTLIVENWSYVETQFVGSSSTVALECEDSENLYSATDITGFSSGSIVSGAVTGLGAGTMLAAIAASCDVSAVIGGADVTDGVLNHFIEYVVHD